MVDSECKFCSIHKYGVIVLNVSALCLLVAVLCIYWNEIVNFCCKSGTSRRSVHQGPYPADQTMPGHPDDQTMNQPTAQQEDPQMRILRLHQQQQQQQQMLLQQQQMQMQAQQQPQQMLSPPSLMPPAHQHPPAQTSVHIAIPMPPQLRYYGPQKHKHHHHHHEKTPEQSPVAPKSPMKSAVAQPPPSPPSDPFKLPKPEQHQQHHQEQQVTAHESTGSDYFKQMLKGKKPVASISQYRNIKNQPKKPKKAKKAKDKNKQEKNKGKVAEKNATKSNEPNIATGPGSSGNKEAIMVEKINTKEVR